MDSQGGGQLIWPELNKTQQRINGVERTVTPIATVDDSSVGNAHLILCLFLREHCELLWPMLNPGVDSLYTSAHNALRDMVLHAEVLFPKPFNDRPAAETAAWPVEKKWALKMLDEVAAATGERACGHEGHWRVGFDAEWGVPVFGGGQEGPGVCGAVCAGAGLDLAEGGRIGICQWAATTTRGFM